MLCVKMNLYKHIHNHSREFPKQDLDVVTVSKGYFEKKNITFPANFKHVSSHSIPFEFYSRH